MPWEIDKIDETCRRERYGLRLHPDKTRYVDFRSGACIGGTRQRVPLVSTFSAGFGTRLGEIGIGRVAVHLQDTAESGKMTRHASAPLLSSNR